ncbi:MurR/RpiR family transcriptional regulator [Nocardiopsis exhalans]|uniref:MurR/RpiR family transcriptional regulator n=1 Tax=Nocardiopsis exhalans TaxID=163604 RepID=A0ABY5D9G4_9ACTN|nr:MurR/RpiR family transcriptional regulator [Nocardiopsis exhalans]USY21001.1 MurR/RpiR family transcriptional regulator [Nocardiopsis exhalans]
MKSSTIADSIRTRLGDFSSGERRVARALLASYPTAGLETVRLLAERAGVSAPTVLRFANRLGFANYPEFQRSLLEELSERDQSPLNAYSSGAAEGARESLDPEHLGRSAAATLSEAVEETLTGIPRYELEAAVGLLSDTDRRVVACGGRFSRVLAQYLVLHLMQVRGRSTVLPDSPVERADLLCDAGRRDVFVILDFRRYEEEHLRLAERVAEQEAKVVLLTDRWLSPVSGVADVVLPAQVGSLSAYDSLVPTMAVCEALVAGVIHTLGDRAEERLRRFEETSRGFGLL